MLSFFNPSTIARHRRSIGRQKQQRKKQQNEQIIIASNRMCLREHVDHQAVIRNRLLGDRANPSPALFSTWRSRRCQPPPFIFRRLRKADRLVPLNPCKHGVDVPEGLKVSPGPTSLNLGPDRDRNVMRAVGLPDCGPSRAPWRAPLGARFW